MTVFSEIPLPEEIGQDTLWLTKLQGRLLDIHGRPVPGSVKASLNKRVAKYKTKTHISGAEQEISADEITGFWSLDIPDNFNMTPDVYYRLTINEQVFRKNLPDFPTQINFNDLEDY